MNQTASPRILMNIGQELKSLRKADAANGERVEKCIGKTSYPSQIPSQSTRYEYMFLADFLADQAMSHNRDGSAAIQVERTTGFKYE